MKLQCGTEVDIVAYIGTKRMAYTLRDQILAGDRKVADKTNMSIMEDWQSLVIVRAEVIKNQECDEHKLVIGCIVTDMVRAAAASQTADKLLTRPDVSSFKGFI